MRQTLCRYAIWYGDDMRIKCTMCIFDLILPACSHSPLPAFLNHYFLQSKKSYFYILINIVESIKPISITHHAVCCQFPYQKLFYCIETNQTYQLNNEKLEKLQKINQLEEELRTLQETSITESAMSYIFNSVLLCVCA